MIPGACFFSFKSFTIRFLLLFFHVDPVFSHEGFPNIGEKKFFSNYDPPLNPLPKCIRTEKPYCERLKRKKQAPGIIQNPFHYMQINISKILKHHEKCPGKNQKLPNFFGFAKGGGVPPVLLNTKLFPFFSCEGFPYTPMHLSNNQLFLSKNFKTNFFYHSFNQVLLSLTIFSQNFFQQLSFDQNFIFTKNAKIF